MANGDLAHAVLFGGFAAVSFGAMAVFERRAQAVMAPSAWAAVRASTAILTLAPLASTTWRRMNGPTIARALAIAAGVYLLLLTLHEPVIGVSPAPH